MTIIKSAGTGGYGMAVDSEGKALTRAVTETENQHAVLEQNGYNINTGNIGLTSSTASAVLYFKNGEDLDFAIDAIAVGVDSSGTTDNDTLITVVRNPTAGTIVSNATAVDMNQNRDFGSSNTLSESLAYKGAEGYTFTDGNDIVQFYTDAGSRLYAGIDFILRKGNSIGVKVDTNTTSGTTNVYVALIGHLRETYRT